MLSEYDLATMGRVCRGLKVKAFDELAKALGEDPDGFEAELRDQFPEAAAFVESRMAAEEGDLLEKRLKSASSEERAGLVEALKRIRSKVTSLCMFYLSRSEFRPLVDPAGFGLVAAKAAPSVAKAPPRVRKPAKQRSDKPVGRDIEVAGPVPAGAVGGETMSKIALGLASREYLGRVVVVFKRPGDGLFGCSGGRERFEEHSVVGGVVNMCDMREPEPTPYWAVLDAMSELGTFTKETVVEKAMGRYSGCSNAAKQRGRLGVAFDVLKGHHRHPRKKGAGMAHMVDDHGKGKPLTIRPRDAGETLQYFESGKARRDGFGKPPSGVVRDAEGAPAEAVTVVVGAPR